MMSKSNKKSSWTKASFKKLIYLFQLKCYLSAHQCSKLWKEEYNLCPINLC